MERTHTYTERLLFEASNRNEEFKLSVRCGVQKEVVKEAVVKPSEETLHEAFFDVEPPTMEDYSDF